MYSVGRPVCDDGDGGGADILVYPRDDDKSGSPDNSALQKRVLTDRPVSSEVKSNV